MATKLDRFLRSIDPSRVVDETFARIDDAMNSFRGMPAQITEWPEFRRRLVELMGHIENRVLRLGAWSGREPEHDWSQCVRYLRAEFGPSGEKAAFEMARTGNEGGLYGVAQAIASHMAQDYCRNEIAARVRDFLEDLTLDEQFAAAQEYLDRYGHLLPSELTEGSAARLRANFHSVLEEHPYLLRRLGRIGR